MIGVFLDAARREIFHRQIVALSQISDSRPEKVCVSYQILAFHGVNFTL